MNVAICAARRRLGGAAFLAMTMLGSPAPVCLADDTQSRIESLRSEVEELRRRDAESRARMAELERMLREVLEARETGPRGSAPVVAAPPPAESPQQALERALEDPDAAAGASPGSASPPATEPIVLATAGAARGDLLSAGVGSGQLRLMDLSLATLVAGGGSSVGDEPLGQLQGGHHDPHRNGFTLQQVELSLAGAVDPWFMGEAHIVATDEGVELEEAFLRTSSLPYGLQVEAGYSLTEFGLVNPAHPHAWDWLDQPVINTRMFGGESTRSSGARVDWLLPLPFFSELHFGVQNANEGEFTPSFMADESVGGRPSVDRDVRGFDDLLWLVRANSAWELGSEAALLLGASMLYGPNQTGPDGDTWIYGVDAKVRWRPDTNFRGWPFVVWQTEAIARDYRADGFVAGTDLDPESGDFPGDLPSDTLHDYGFYTQLLAGFTYGWAAGLRAEYVTGEGSSIAGGVTDARANDPFRDDRLRISPLLVWHPSEYSRLRLQYNYDDADHLDEGHAHTIWIGAEVLYGKHVAHQY